MRNDNLNDIFNEKWQLVTSMMKNDNTSYIYDEKWRYKLHLWWQNLNNIYDEKWQFQLHLWWKMTIKITSLMRNDN